MNVRRHQLPLGAAAVLLLLALATMGVAFGLWSKVLTIEGTVNTGEVDAVWFYKSCSSTQDKPVASWTVEPDPLDQEILIVTVDNAYSSFDLDCEIHIANSGSVPVKLRGISGPAPDPAPDVLVGLFDGIPTQLEPCGSTPPFGTSPLTLPANCQTAMSLLLHVEQSADQNAGRGQAGDPPPYEFQFKVCVAQWNEPATSAECFAAAP